MGLDAVWRAALETAGRWGIAVVRGRSMQPTLQPGWDVLVIARPAIVGADLRAIRTALGRLLARGGVLAEHGGEMGLGRG